MNPKRTKRIQTVISPSHHELLSELTKTHGKMNHIIEKGIELVHQNKTGIHTCDASNTLKIQEQMIQGGYIFFDSHFLENLFKSIANGTMIEWLYRYLREKLEAGNPLLTIIDVNNTYQGLLEYLQLESDYFKLYNVKFYDDGKSSITLQPLLLPQYPVVSTTILCRTLDFLNFNYNIDILQNEILIYYLDPEQQAVDHNTRYKAILDRYLKLFSEINPTGFQYYQLAKKIENLSYSEFSKRVMENIKTFEVFNWQKGDIEINKTKSVLLPQKCLFNILKTDTSQKTEILKEISISFYEYSNFTLEDKSLDSFCTNLSKFWSTIGFGQLTVESTEKEKITKIFVKKNTLLTEWIIEILNPLIQLFNVQINQVGKQKDDLWKSKVEENLTFDLISLKKSVLIVDDEPDILEALQREIRLIDKEIQIITTTEPLKVAALLQKSKIDIDFIIIDHKMKGMTGIEVLESIKNEYPNMKRILMTGYGDTKIMTNAINRSSIHYFINKPWKTKDIKKALEN